MGGIGQQSFKYFKSIDPYWICEYLFYIVNPQHFFTLNFRQMFMHITL